MCTLISRDCVPFYKYTRRHVHLGHQGAYENLNQIRNVYLIEFYVVIFLQRFQRQRGGGRRRRRNTYLRLSASFIILRKGYDLFVLVLLFLISQDAFSVFGGHPEILNFWYLRVITGVEAELGIQVVVFMRLPPLQLRPGHLSWWQ